MNQHKTSKRSRKSKKSKRPKDSKKSKGGLEKSDKTWQYLTKLCKYLKDNKLFCFWVEAGDKFSNKIHASK